MQSMHLSIAPGRSQNHQAKVGPKCVVHGPDTLATAHNHDALPMEVAKCSYVFIYIRIHMYKGQMLCICTLGKRYAFACWPSRRSLPLLYQWTRGQCNSPPPWSNLLIDTSSKALMPSAASVKVTTHRPFLSLPCGVGLICPRSRRNTCQ